MELLKTIINGVHKLARPALLGGLVYTVTYLASIKSSALPAMVAITTAGITQYFQLKGGGEK